MRRYCLVFVISLVICNQAAAKNWLELYGKTVAFDVYRNGRHVGQSSTVFAKDKQGWEVATKMTISVPLLFFFTFDYSYDSREYWQNGILQQLDINEDRNGKIKKTNARADKDEQILEGSSSSGDIKIELPILTSNHYNNAVIQRRRLLNTLTGQVNEYALVSLGEEKIQTNKGLVEANRYRYEGELSDTEVWYSETGHWVKLWFKGDDGSDIELRCVTCIK